MTRARRGRGSGSLGGFTPLPDNGFFAGQASRGEFIAQSKEGCQSRRPAMVSGAGIAFWGFRKTRESYTMRTGHLGEEFFETEGRGERTRRYGHAGEQKLQAGETWRDPRRIPGPSRVSRAEEGTSRTRGRRGTGNIRHGSPGVGIGARGSARPNGLVQRRRPKGRRESRSA